MLASKGHLLADAAHGRTIMVAFAPNNSVKPQPEGGEADQGVQGKLQIKTVSDFSASFGYPTRSEYSYGLAWAH